MASSSSPNNRVEITDTPIRLTITLPLESNPIITRITHEITKLQRWEKSSTSVSETISIGLFGVSNLYNCTTNILTSPLTKQSLTISEGSGYALTSLLEQSRNILEICTASRHIVTQLKQTSMNLRRRWRSTVIRKNHELNRDLISSFIRLRKEIMKSSNSVLQESYKIKLIGGGSRRRQRPLDGVHDHSCLSVVINVVKCISVINQSICESLLLFLSMRPVGKKKPCRSSGLWFLMSKVVSKGRLVEDFEGGNRNELEDVDVVISGADYRNEDDVRIVCKRLEGLEVGLEGMENGLDSVVSKLTETRASLMTILLCFSRTLDNI